MAFEPNRIKRIGGVILEVCLGVFLVAILVSALRTPESQARSGKARAVKTARGGESLLPLQGTPVFGFCLQDDSNGNNVVLFNLAGDYNFCCNSVLEASGRGTVLVKGGVVQIEHNPGTYRVLIKADTTVKKGTASLQKPPGVSKCVIIDRNMANNTCVCGETQQAGAH